MARRAAARTELLSFTRYTNPAYRPGAMHARIAEALERVERGDCRRLMIFSPPRHGKSELVSRRFPAWALGRDPTRQFISASYGQDLASDFGRDVRNLVASPEFNALFPGVGLAEDSGAKARWHTSEGGSYVAAGVGTAITGRGADILSIDDPVKDRAEAESAVVRDAVWAWYTSTAFTRLMPGGAVILTQTRWHADDLAGRLLDQMAAGGERWEVLNLQAIDEDGEALWPERYPLVALEGIRATIGDRDWSALYQQSPIVSDGAVFKVEAITVRDTPLERGTMIRAWDLAATAATQKRSPDWTVGLLLHQSRDNRLTVCDIVRLRAGPEGVERAIVETVERDGPDTVISLPIDPGAAGKVQAEYLTRQLLGYTVRTSRETGSKATRAMPVASQANVGNLSIMRAPWNRAFLEELRGFPNAQHDDQVDALSRAFAEVATPAFDASYSWVS